MFNHIPSRISLSRRPKRLFLSELFHNHSFFPLYIIHLLHESTTLKKRLQPLEFSVIYWQCPIGRLQFWDIPSSGILNLCVACKPRLAQSSRISIFLRRQPSILSPRNGTAEIGRSSGPTIYRHPCVNICNSLDDYVDVLCYIRWVCVTREPGARLR
jgi:hypothetical protein